MLKLLNGLNCQKKKNHNFYLKNECDPANFDEALSYHTYRSFVRKVQGNSWSSVGLGWWHDAWGLLI